MKKLNLLIAILVFGLHYVNSQNEILIEGESFIDKGGWVDGSIEKSNWEILKKALDLDPELGIKETMHNSIS